MRLNLYFDYCGISYRVKATITEGQVEDVRQVEAVSHTGQYVPLEVDREVFLADLQDVLNDAVEQAILDERLAHEDALFEQAREEGRL